jgi:hypothetical protein
LTLTLTGGLAESTEKAEHLWFRVTFGSRLMVNGSKFKSATLTINITETKLRGEGNKNGNCALIYHKICGW